MVPLDDVPDELFMSELVMLEPVLLPLVLLPLVLLPLRVVLLLLMPEDDVDGVVVVFASVERSVLGVVLPLDIVPVLGDVVDMLPLLGDVVDMLPVLGDVVDMLPVLPGLVVPVGEAVVDDGLVVDGLVLVVPDGVVPEGVVPEEVWAWARLTAPTRAAIEAAAVKVLENFMKRTPVRTVEEGRLPGRYMADGLLALARLKAIDMPPPRRGTASDAHRVIGLQGSGIARKSSPRARRRAGRCFQFFAASSASHEGEQTAWARPSTLRVFIRFRSRCLPHRKHDMVAPPKVGAALNGEPGVFDL